MQALRPAANAPPASTSDPLTRPLLQGIEYLLDTSDEAASTAALFNLYFESKARAEGGHADGAGRGAR